MTINTIMNVKFIHSFILLLLLSLTVLEVHASLNHDAETCDVCIHIQSNDHALGDENPQYIILDMAFQCKIKAKNNSFNPLIQPTADYIRGPPIYS